LIPIGHRGYPLRAHRLSLQIATGQTGDGLSACHRCDVPSCVNPAHLFWGTVRDNARDAAAKGRLHNKVNAAKTMCPHGHPYSSENTYIHPTGRRVCITCTKAARKRYEERIGGEKYAAG
jgi:hypothetical protein